MKIGQIETKRLWSTETFLLSVCVILAVTAAAKVVSIFGSAGILDQPNALFAFLSNRTLLLLAAALEFGVAGWILFGGASIRPKVEGVLWLAAVFLIYRSGLWAIGYEGACSCMGSMTEAVGLSSGMADKIAVGLLAYMAIPSLVIVLFSRSKHVMSDHSPATSRSSLLSIRENAATGRTSD